MPVVRPFRALRAAPARVDVGAVVVGSDDEAALLAREPRNLVRVLRARAEEGVSVDGVATRARFHLAEFMRAGVFARDATPGVYVVRVVAADVARTGFFAAMRTGSIEGPGVVDDVTKPSACAAGVVGDAVVVAYTDRKGRVARALETETDRDPDVSFVVDGARFELWVVDDDSATARLTALVEGAAPRVIDGAGVLGLLHAAARQAPSPDDAASFALGYFVDDEHPAPALPAGIVLCPLQGSL
jgi:hypothetical protein